HLHDFRSGGGEGGEGCLHRRLHRLLEALTGEFLHHSDLHARDVTVEGRRQTGPFPRIGGRVSGIMTPDRLQEDGGVLDTAGQRTDLVEGGGESDEAVAAHTSVRRLYPDDAAQGGGLADGSTGVGA